MAEPRRVLALKSERLLVVALEHGDEESQRKEGVGAELEQLHVIVSGERLPLLVREDQPGRTLLLVAVQDQVRPPPLPPLDEAARVLAVALDQLRVAVDSEEELVEEVLAQRLSPPGYQVK